jgi:hypothetical protein
MHGSTGPANRTSVPVKISYDWQFIYGAKWWQTARWRARRKTGRGASTNTASSRPEPRNSLAVNAKLQCADRSNHERQSSKR